MTAEVRILRSGPGRSSFFETFRVPLPAGAQVTAMDVLDYIRRHLDGTVAYFRHSACDRGLCRRCMARINGRAGLLCEHLVQAGERLTLEPVSRKNVIRDLVCHGDGFDKPGTNE